VANFTGSGADEIITPSFVSSSVIPSGQARPSNAADSIDGGAGNDTIDSGGGNDSVTGGRGNDVATLGSGNDTFIWNPGDGSDVVDGGSGFDTLHFNGSNAAEHVNIFANGAGAELTRDIAAITMNLTSMERIELAAFGSADTITVGDLTGSGVKQVAIDLAGTLGGGDGVSDNVIASATAGNDHISLSTSGSLITVNGLPEQFTVDHAEATDVLTIEAGAGNDTIDASALSNVTLMFDGGDGNDTLAFNGSGADDTFTLSALSGALVETHGTNTVTVELANVEDIVISGGDGNDTIRAGNGMATLAHLTLSGGAGNDTITGGDGADTLIGGGGNDSVTGGRGNDVATLGSGDDTYIWNPGDGSDVVDGGSGFDTLKFNGSNAAEHIDIFANGSQAEFTRDVAAITMNLTSMERIEFAALGGADTINVGDLSGSGVKQVAIDLAGVLGGGGSSGDGASDNVIASASAGNNHIGLST
jgi:Ca2+-binding RTX toxin-like protein